MKNRESEKVKSVKENGIHEKYLNVYLTKMGQVFLSGNLEEVVEMTAIA